MESKPKKELLRLTRSEDGVRRDPTGKANGRGVYLCKDADCFKKAKKRRAISRGLEIELSEEQLGRLFAELEEVFVSEHKDS
jgi:predicted RNA-binding protein YlxR (DUF448 family)